MGFSRREYWSGLPRAAPGDLPDPGTEAASPVSPAVAGGFFTTRPTWVLPANLAPTGAVRAQGKGPRVGRWSISRQFHSPLSPHPGATP